MKPVALVGSALVVALVSPGVNAQQVLAQAFGSAAFDDFGRSLAAAGPDLDGDGFAEIAVGASITNSGALPYIGSATVLSGRDFTPIQTIYGTNDHDFLGASLAWCDDLDGDGVADLVVGMPRSSIKTNWSEGRVRIYSTTTWTVLREYDGAQYDGLFGESLATIRDLDGDGVADLLIGAMAEFTYPAPGRGAVYVYSGKGGALIRRINATDADILGACVADVGDVDGDGVDDIGAGAPQSADVYPAAGAAYVFSGADGSQLQRWHGQSNIYWQSGYTYYEGNHFGTRLGAAGDVDGDGKSDVWVSSSRGLPEPAFIGVYSGATGATLRTIEGVDLQSGAFAVGDLTGDGITEFGAGGWLHSGADYRDEVLLFSGVDGKELWRGERPDWRAGWGSALAATGDVNHDGLADFAVGAPADDTIAGNAGRVDLIASNDLWLDVSPTHFPTAGDSVVASAAEGPTSNLVGLFLTEVNGTPTFALLALSTFDAAGQAQWSGVIPAGYAGATITLRAFAIGRTHRLIDTSSETLAIQ